MEDLQRGGSPQLPSSAHIHTSSNHGEEDSKLSDFLAGLNAAKKAAAPASATATQLAKPETTSVEETINRVSATESTSANLSKSPVPKPAPPASPPAKKVLRSPPLAVLYGSISAGALSLCGIGAVILFTFGSNSQSVKDKTPEATPKMAMGSAVDRGKASRGTASAAPQSPAQATNTTSSAWRPLFDGTSLAGWEKLGTGNGTWTVDNGELVGRGGATKLVYTAAEYGDFDLRAEVQFADQCNAGLFFHSGMNNSHVDLYEVQIGGGGGYDTGSLYGLDQRAVPSVRSNTWFQLDVQVRGNHFVSKVNDVVTADCTDRDNRFPRGYLALQGHPSTTEVRFRKIEVRVPGATSGTARREGSSADFALSFNGQDNYVEIPTLTSVNPSIVTAEGWFWPQKPTGWGAVSVFGPNCLGIWSASASEMGFTSFDGAVDLTNRFVAVNWNAARPVHLAFVREPTEARIYINGKRQPIKQTAFASQNQGSGPARLGAGGPPKRIEGYFAGQMDELRFSSIARYTADFVPTSRFEPDEHTIALYHFNDGQGDVLTDSSPNKHHGKVVGAKWVPAFGSPSASPSAAGWTALFNGKDLSGWKQQPGDMGYWHVEDGVLKGQVATTSYLFSDGGDWTNFHLRVETRVNSGGSAGITCRTPFGVAGPAAFPSVVLGYLAKINANSSSDPRKTGSLYVIRKDSINDGVTIDSSAIQPDEWFTMETIVEDNRVIIKVNDQTTTDFRDSLRQFTSGHIALQAFQSGTRVEFRRIEIQELNLRR